MMKRILSLVLIITILFGMFAFPTIANNQLDKPKVDASVNDVITTETEDQVSVETYVEGSTVKGIYDKTTEEYALYLDEQKYEVAVVTEGEYTFIFFEDEESLPYEDGAVAQSALALAATAGYWTPAVIAAAKTVLAGLVKVTVTVAGSYIAAEAIGTTISGIKNRSITKSKVKTASGDRALDIIKRTGFNKRSYYYEAYLYGDLVMVGRQITEFQAQTRLRQGKDVFASDSLSASRVASAASVGGFPKFHRAHAGCGDRFPHYHATGRKWVCNRRHEPHCWFPV